MAFNCVRMNWKLFIENNERTYSIENKYYYWFSYNGTKEIISMNPFGHLELEKTRRDENRHFIIDNKECLCYHGFLHPIKSRNDKCTPGNLYNQIKKILIKKWNRNRLLGLY